MRIIHVLRKPLSEGAVASNVVKHGCGGLNIDASRISSTGAHMRPFQPTNNAREVYGAQTGFQPTNHAGGRWPANVILQHLDGCRCDGVKRVKGTGVAVQRNGKGMGKGGLFAGGGGGLNGDVAKPDQTYVGSDGKETVANWVCGPGCPVARLDEQSGVLKSGALPSTQYTEGDRDNSSMFSGDGVFTHKGYKADTGGASRFYKQVGGKSDG